MATNALGLAEITSHWPPKDAAQLIKSSTDMKVKCGNILLLLRGKPSVAQLGWGGVGGHQGKGRQSQPDSFCVERNFSADRSHQGSVNTQGWRIHEFFPPFVSQKQLCFLLQSTKLSPVFPEPDKGNNSSVLETKLNQMISCYFDGRKMWGICVPCMN